MASKGVALVTGAASGIGRAIALRLAEDGFDVALNDLPSSKESLETVVAEIAQKGRKALIAFGDVTAEDDVKSMVDYTVEHLGQLNVMVANAGTGFAKSIMDTSIGEWDRLFNLNVRGVFLCYKYAAQQMIKQGRGGRIIGASSLAGKQGQPTSAAYCSTKFAVRGLTQSTAIDLGPHKITVNTYAPGAVDTPMSRRMAEDVGGFDGFKDNISKFVPLGDLAKPEDIASVVSYLASKEAHLITGQTISVDGGMSFS